MLADHPVRARAESPLFRRRVTWVQAPRVLRGSGEISFNSHFARGYFARQTESWGRTGGAAHLPNRRTNVHEAFALRSTGAREARHSGFEWRDTRSLGSCARHHRRDDLARVACAPERPRSGQTSSGGWPAAPWSLRREGGEVYLHWPELFRSRQGIWHEAPVGAGGLHEGDVGDLRPQ